MTTNQVLGGLLTYAGLLMATVGLVAASGGQTVDWWRALACWGLIIGLSGLLIALMLPEER